MTETNTTNEYLRPIPGVLDRHTVWASGVRVGDLVDGIPVVETMEGLPGFFWFRTDDGTWWQCTDDQKIEVGRHA